MGAHRPSRIQYVGRCLHSYVSSAEEVYIEAISQFSSTLYILMDHSK